MAVAVLLAVTCLSAWLPLLGEQQMPADLAASAGWWWSCGRRGMRMPS